MRTDLRVLLCLLLLIFGSTAQAAHSHGNLLTSNRAQVNAYTGTQAFLGEDLCPLCAAMHGVFTAPASPVLQVAVLKTVAVPETPRSIQAQLWRYELFGRPPPSLL